MMTFATKKFYKLLKYRARHRVFLQKTLIENSICNEKKRLQDYDLRTGTLNIQTLYRLDATAQLIDALKKYRTDITLTQIMRQIGHGFQRLPSCDMQYSCHERSENFDVDLWLVRDYANLSLVSYIFFLISFHFFHFFSLFDR